MTHYDDPQAVEDAYYDAFDDHDIELMMSVWADSDETVCLLPMLPAIKGLKAIRQAFTPLLKAESKFDITVKHLHWINTENIAIHLVEELIQIEGQPNQSVYATNVFQKDANGNWHLSMHQNSPVPMPPPGT